MNNQEINQHHQATFDSIKHFDEQGDEYWYARELAPVLDYQQWRNFLPVLTKAQAACNNSQQLVSDHFAHIRKMVEIGSGAARRYGCKNIHAHKNLKKSDKILDRIGSTKLAANLFRATQTEEKLRRDNIQGKQHALANPAQQESDE